MADCRLRGPTDRWEQSLTLDNGCSGLQAGGPRGPVLGPQPGHASEWDPFVLARRAMALQQACALGVLYAPDAITRLTGLDEPRKLLDNVIDGILKMLLVLGAFIVVGGAAGAVAGAVLGLGAGAIPAGAAGAELGFDAGLAFITWMGLGFLVVEIGRGIGKVMGLVNRAVALAWAADDMPDRTRQIDWAGHLMGEAVGQLILLILMAIVARLTAGQVKGLNSNVAASVAEVKAALNGSVLKGGFADWVAVNAERLMGNPRLRAQAASTGKAGAAKTAGTGETPSSLARSGRSGSGEPLAFEAPTLAGITPVRTITSSGNKVAVVGQSMESRVKVYAQALEKQGYKVELFDGPMVPKAAADEWAVLTSNGKVRLTDAEAIQTKMFQADEAWSIKLKEQGYSIIDIGPNPNATGASPFYEMEKRILFGD